mmetsp:Transcript_76984/g.160197  ORF Transcript_76984/g.160197 Transcript_76984/m.160197 type:complete len:921 (+) Transcript_76984:119-2881(+)
MALVPVGVIAGSASPAGAAAASSLGSLPFAGAFALGTSAITYMGCKRRRTEPKALADSPLANGNTDIASSSSPCGSRSGSVDEVGGGAGSSPKASNPFGPGLNGDDVPIPMHISPERITSLEERMARAEARLGVVEATLSTKADAKAVDDVMGMLSSVKSKLNKKADEKWVAGQLNDNADIQHDAMQDIHRRLDKAFKHLDKKADYHAVDQVKSSLKRTYEEHAAANKAAFTNNATQIDKLNSKVESVRLASSKELEELRAETETVQKAECQYIESHISSLTQKVEEQAGIAHTISELSTDFRKAEEVRIATMATLQQRLDTMDETLQDKADKQDITFLQGDLDGKAVGDDVNMLGVRLENVKHLVEDLKAKVDRDVNSIKEALQHKALSSDVGEKMKELMICRHRLDELEDILDQKADTDDLESTTCQIGLVSDDLRRLKSEMLQKAGIIDEMDETVIMLKTDIASIESLVHDKVACTMGQQNVQLQRLQDTLMSREEASKSLEHRVLEVKALTEEIKNKVDVEISHLRDAIQSKASAVELNAKLQDLAMIRETLTRLEEDLVCKVDCDELETSTREICVVRDELLRMKAEVRQKVDIDELEEKMTGIAVVKQHFKQLESYVNAQVDSEQQKAIVEKLAGRVENLDETMKTKAEKEEMQAAVQTLVKQVSTLMGKEDDQKSVLQEFAHKLEALSEALDTKAGSDEQKTQISSIWCQLRALQEAVSDKSLESARQMQAQVEDSEELDRKVEGVQQQLSQMQTEHDSFKGLGSTLSRLEALLATKADGCEFEMLRQDVEAVSDHLEEMQVTLGGKVENQTMDDMKSSVGALRVQVQDFHSELGRKADKDDLEHVALEMEHRISTMQEGITENSELAAEQFQSIQDDVGMHIGFQSLRIPLQASAEATGSATTTSESSLLED